MEIRLLDWLDAPDPRNGLHFALDDESWEFHSWEAMAGLVHEAAERIVAERTASGQPITLVLPSGPAFVACFYACLLVGNIPCPLAPPNALQDPDAYLAHAAGLLRATRPTLVITSDEFAPTIGEAARQAGLERAPHRLELTGSWSEQPRQRPAQLALLQFTSGSTGGPRAARVTWENLEANIAMIVEFLRATGDDSIATWLPLHHDMGLIGATLTPCPVAANEYLMQPHQFVRDPLRWIECYGRSGVTISCAPTFALAYARRRVDSAQLEGMDFTSWRAAVVGAERLDAAALTRFAEWLAPYGFRASAFHLAYGLAEATVFVSGRGADKPPPAVRLDWSRLAFGEAVAVAERARVGDCRRIRDGAGWLVSCGSTYAGCGVRIIGADGAALGERVLGEVCVSGPSIADGYQADDLAGAARFVDRELHTGDGGFLLDGELYVVGRLGDSLNVRGRLVFAEDLEAILVRVDGLNRGNCVVFSGTRDEGEGVVALAELDAGPWAAQSARLLADELGADVHVEVRAAPRGTIRRTSSGKPRRRLMWRAHVESLLAGEVLAEVPRDEPHDLPAAA